MLFINNRYFYNKETAVSEMAVSEHGFKTGKNMRFSAIIPA